MNTNEEQGIRVVLECCRMVVSVSIRPRAIARSEPNEVRKNLTCPRCRKLVILEFKDPDGEEVEQEVIDLGGA